MHEDLLQPLGRLRPRIKARWEALLRAAPTPSPLAHPDVVVYLLDEILDRLEDTLRATPGAVPPAPAALGPSGACACGLNPLLPCFITGEQALIECAAPELGPRLNHVLTRYHELADEQLRNFCGVCLHRESAVCPSPLSGT